MLKTYILIALLIILVLFGCLEQKNTSNQLIAENKQAQAIEKQNQENQDINQTSKIINLTLENQTNQTTQQQNQQILNQTIEVEILNQSQEQENTTNLEIKNFEPKIEIDLKAYPFVISTSNKNCKISISPNILEPGQEVKTEVYINAYYAEAFYDCANEKKFAGSNGIFRQMSICKFLNEGIFKQSTYIGEDECAYTYVFVVSPLNKNKKMCKLIEQSTQEQDGISEYKLRLFVYKFEQDEKLIVRCNNKTKEILLKELFPTSDYGMIDITCNADATIDNFNAKIENKECNLNG